MPAGFWKQTSLESLAVLAGASALACGWNAVSPKGIPFTRAMDEKALDPRYLTPEETKDRFEAGRSIFVDARKGEEFAKGHIEGALNLPAEEFAEWYAKLAPRLPREVEIVAYCGGRDCAMSRELADRLREAGYAQVRIFRGGWEVWKAKGWPAE